MFVIDFEIEGFSATQRTIIGSGLQALEISASKAKEEDEGPNVTLTAYTPRAQHHQCEMCCKLCASTQSKWMPGII
jgi:hypothetical protein